MPPEQTKQQADKEKHKSQQCIRFLDIYGKLRASVTSEAEEQEAIVKAMRQAGYKEKCGDTKLVRMGRALLEAYDTLAGSAEEVFNSAGLTDRWLAEQLKKGIEDTESKTARATCLSIATKCKGWQRDTLELDTGVPVLIVKHGEGKAREVKQVKKPKPPVSIAIVK